MNSILELRQKDSDITSQNGAWKSVLPQSVTIEKGDSILVKDTFIDTQQSSTSKILIEKPVSIFADFGYYQVNNIQDWYLLYNTSNPVLTGSDNKNRVLTYEATGAATDSLLKEYVLVAGDEGSKRVEITYNMLDENGDPIFIPAVIIPALKPNEKYVVGELANRIIDNVYGVQLDKLYANYGLAFHSQQLESLTGRKILFPIIDTKGITIPAGNYTPDELVKIINTEFNLNNLNNDEFMTSNPSFLRSSRAVQFGYHDFATNTNTNELYMVKADTLADPYGLKFARAYPAIAANENDLYLGSNQFEISYNESNNQYALEYIHTPLYYQGNISIQYRNDLSVLPDIKIDSVNKRGGIFFQRLWGLNGDGTANDFWKDVLHFDLDSLQVNFTYAEHVIGPDTLLLPQLGNQLEDGKTTTGNLSTLASAVPTNIQLAGIGDVGGLAVPTEDDITGDYFATTDISSTFAIAGNNAIDTINNFGYYLVEVRSNFKNNFLTPSNNFNSIHQIVSRYYEVNSYTSGEGGQIVYTHESDEPLMLQSFDCRILKSDKTIPTFIGDDNSIHIQIVKGK